tara:strand:- start:4027 stop:4632 length:606 start_codon:yes stop_codon:yes gene_type:complete
MTERKRKLRFIQASLLLLGALIIFMTYGKKEKKENDEIISKKTQERIELQIDKKNSGGDTFFNIEYSGIDLSGNRYILKSEEAKNVKTEPELVYMKLVTAIFYFKDDSILKVTSDEGKYNNKTLDMNFNNNVKAYYEGSELYAQKAEYSNSQSYLIISHDVKIKDIKGTIIADKLLFDIKKQTLNIASFNDGKINANVKLK